MQTRIQFIDDVQSGNIETRNIVLSDEYHISLCPDSNWVWRRRGKFNPRTMRAKEKFNDSLMIWGAIGIRYKCPLLIFDTSVDLKAYITKLISSNAFGKADELYGERNRIFSFIYQNITSENQ